MKTVCGLFILLLASFAMIANTFAQSPQEQLAQMVAQLQKTPTDQALREKVIKLGAEMNPPPVVPDEAVRFEGRGQFAFKNAKSQSDYASAAQEYQKAVVVAPWVAGYYSDLCTIYEKTGKYGDAKRNCQFYMAALSDPKDITEVKRRIAGLEYGIEQANSPGARAAREKEAEQRFIASLEGAKYVCPEYRDNEDARHVEIDIRNGKIHGANIVTWINPKLRPGVDYSSNLFVGFRGLWFEDIPLQGRVNVKRLKYEEMRVEIYDDRLVYVHQITYGNDTSPTVRPAQTCVRTK